MSHNIKTDNYDILFIIKPHLSDEVYSKLTESFQKWINTTEGSVHFLKAMGIRDLATPISRMTQGYFVHCQFNGSAKTLEMIKDKMAVDENFVRHLIVKLDSIQAKKTAEVNA